MISQEQYTLPSNNKDIQIRYNAQYIIPVTDHNIQTTKKCITIPHSPVERHLGLCVGGVLAQVALVHLAAVHVQHVRVHRVGAQQVPADITGYSGVHIRSKVGLNIFVGKLIRNFV